jgi:plastocyanin
VILRTPTLLLLSAFALTGCKQVPVPATSSPATTPVAAHPAPPVNPATAGSISGVIRFTGHAPARVPIDMSADPACNLTNLTNLTEQIIVANQHLTNVYVYIKSGAPSYTAVPMAPAVPLNQKGCRYSPHVIAVQQGGSVIFSNSDATVHNVHTMPQQPGNASIDISQPAGSAPRTQVFSTPEVMLPVRCNNHPWMSAFINVAPNPWFAISGIDGKFTITGVPPGTYTLAAVHEKLGEQDIQVTVPTKSAAQASFTFSAK